MILVLEATHRQTVRLTIACSVALREPRDHVPIPSTRAVTLGSTPNESEQSYTAVRATAGVTGR